MFCIQLISILDLKPYFVSLGFFLIFFIYEHKERDQTREYVNINMASDVQER